MGKKHLARTIALYFAVASFVATIVFWDIKLPAFLHHLLTNVPTNPSNVVLYPWQTYVIFLSLFFLGFLLGAGVILTWYESKVIKPNRSDDKEYITKFTELGLIWAALSIAIIGFALMLYFAFSTHGGGDGVRVLLLSLIGSFLLTFFGYALYRLLRGKKNSTEYSIFGSLFVLILGSASFLPAIVDLAQGISITSSNPSDISRNATAQFGIVVGIIVVVTAGLVTSVLQQKDFSKQLIEELERKIRGIKGFTDFLRHFQEEWAEDLLKTMTHLFDYVKRSEHIKMGLCNMIDESQEIWSRNINLGWNRWYPYQFEMDRMDRLKEIVSNARHYVYALTYDFENYINEFWDQQESKKYFTVNSEQHSIIKRIFILNDEIFDSPPNNESLARKRIVLQKILRGHFSHEIDVHVLTEIASRYHYICARSTPAIGSRNQGAHQKRHRKAHCGRPHARGAKQSFEGRSHDKFSSLR